MAILEALDDSGKEYFDAENTPISHSAERRISNLRILEGAILCGPGTFSARSQIYPGLRPGGQAQPRRGFGSSDIELGTLSQRPLAVLEAEAGPQVFEVRSDNEKELSQDSDLFGRRNVPRLISRVG